jgi:hypothetical protein
MGCSASAWFVANVQNVGSGAVICSAGDAGVDTSMSQLREDTISTLRDELQAERIEHANERQRLEAKCQRLIDALQPLKATVHPSMLNWTEMRLQYGAGGVLTTLTVGQYRKLLAALSDTSEERGNG